MADEDELLSISRTMWSLWMCQREDCWQKPIIAGHLRSTSHKLVGTNSSAVQMQKYIGNVAERGLFQIHNSYGPLPPHTNEGLSGGILFALVFGTSMVCRLKWGWWWRQSHILAYSEKMSTNRPGMKSGDWNKVNKMIK